MLDKYIGRSKRPALSDRLSMLAVCFGFAAAFFLYMTLRNTGLTPFVFADEWTYSASSRLIKLKHVELPSYLYFWVMHVTTKCGPGFLDCARIVNTLFYCAALPLIYVVSRRWNSRGVSLVVAILSIACATNWYTVLFMPESMYFFGFWVLACFVLRTSRANAFRHGLGVGAIIGLMALVKAHGVFLLPSVLVYFVACEWFEGNEKAWRRTASYALGLGLAFLIARFGVGCALGGHAALSLFGTIYGIQTGGFFSLENLETSARNVVSVLFGHSIILCVLYGLPLYVLLQTPIRRRLADPVAADRRQLNLFTILVLGPLLLITAYFTASIVLADANQGANLIHIRYYGFSLPLLLIVGATSLAVKTERRFWYRLLAALLVAAITLYGAGEQLKDYVPSLTGSPEIYGLVLMPALFRIVAILSAVATIGIAFGWSKSAKFFLFVVAPIAIAASAWQANAFMKGHRIQSPYDRAGLITKALLGAGTSRLAIVGPEVFGLYQTRFNVDDAATAMVQMPVGKAVSASDVAGRDWLLLLDGLQAPFVPVFSLKLADGIHLVKSPTAPLVDLREVQSLTVENVDGLSSVMPFGRAILGRKAEIKLSTKLPQHFALNVKGRASGAELNNPVTIRIGNESRTMKFSTSFEVQRTEWTSDGDQNRIVIEVWPENAAMYSGPGANGLPPGIDLESLNVEHL